MKITRITAFALSYRLPQGQTVKVGVGATIKRDTIIVRVETDEGLTGYGESHPGRSPGAVCSLVNQTLDPLLAGMDPCDVVGVWARVNRMQLSSHGLGAGAALALSGIDLALWDIRGKAADMPLYRLLGGSRKRLPAYAGGISMGFQPPEQLVEEARSYVAAGYRAIKLRLGDNVRDDILRVQAVRAGLGDEVEILTDANTAWRLADARRVIPALAEARVGWLEEPFSALDFGAYRIAAGISPQLPIAAGENHYTRYDFARLLEDKAVTIFQPDLSKTGGITEALRIAAMASAFGIAVHPHSSATGINHAASLHFLAALDNGGYFEACVSHFNPMRDMFGRTFEIGADGCVEPLDRPGIGLDIDERIFAEYPAIDGPGYVVTF
ncbi:MAG: mandelate racemase/muconate lactonizing enzyme family protein [Burkholderiaceae bacterium]|nr:mandelate racemase/muconate lactonizing enzyme family protein [Rhodoferax sp.]MCB2003909.1 mandelate racemase/muconate lactonizing enzyme family protein [Rhodoferax sp.]MCP5263719.1 mandelate racemase/muconate lactonizing enzyme family protein [Rhodoferax sp.]MCW5629428.1 mandelate racemase/muconate lactonizing enzyme family protein [Rhodoferax sp.]